MGYTGGFIEQTKTPQVPVPPFKSTSSSRPSRVVWMDTCLSEMTNLNDFALPSGCTQSSEDKAVEFLPDVTVDDVCPLLAAASTDLVEVSGVDTCSLSSVPVSGYADKAKTTYHLMKYFVYLNPYYLMMLL